MIVVDLPTKLIALLVRLWIAVLRLVGIIVRMVAFTLPLRVEIMDYETYLRGL